MIESQRGRWLNLSKSKVVESPRRESGSSHSSPLLFAPRLSLDLDDENHDNNDDDQSALVQYIAVPHLSVIWVARQMIITEIQKYRDHLVGQGQLTNHGHVCTWIWGGCLCMMYLLLIDKL